MTFSIVARSADGESWGVAVASKFLAVGSAVPAAVAGVGAIATQADANVAYKGQALAHLDDGATASVALQRLLEDDEGRDARQVGIVDVEGGAASHTGHACLDWAGSLTGDGYAIQGNILAGEDVVLAMEAAWETSDDDAPLARRLLAALTAGDDAGGDSRGRQSAALLVVREGAGYGGLDDIAVDLRVDDHADPVTELARLLDLNDLYLTASTEEEKVFLTEEQKREVDEKVRGAGLRRPQRLGRHRELRDARRPRRGVARREGAGDPPGHARPMTVLAIDAGTTGVTALVVDEAGSVVAKGYQEFAQHFPRAGLGRARPGGDLAGDPGGGPRGAEEGRRLRAARRRHHQPARDHRGLGPRDPRIAAPGDRVAGPPYRRHLRPLRADGHEDRVTELTGLRLDPYFSGTKLVWLAENEPQTWALVESGPVRRRDGRLLPHRPDDPRHLARHRRLERLPHPAVRPAGRGLVRGAVLAVRRASRRAARPGAELGRDRLDRAVGVLRPVAADRGDGRRPAVGAVRADLLRPRRRQVHLRHRLVHPHQHRYVAGALGRRAAVDGGLALARRRADLRAGRARSS